MIAVETSQLQLIDKVVHISRVAKVVKGGRRFSFSAIVVVGDGNGKVGYMPWQGKRSSRGHTQRNGIGQAEHGQHPTEGNTIPHEVLGRFGASSVVLKPASPGTGVIAGGAVRAIMEAAGIHDILTKCVGSRNPHNVVKATIEGLKKLRSVEQVSKIRGKNILEGA